MKKLKPLKKLKEQFFKIISKFNFIKKVEKQSGEIKKIIDESTKLEAEYKKQSFIQTDQNKKMLKWSKRYFILAIITLIITIGLTFILFHLQISNEHKRQIEEHISNIESLEKELEKNLEIANLIIEQPNNYILTTMHPEFSLENINERITDGNIRNDTIKTSLIVLKIYLSEANNDQALLNSPEFITSNVIELQNQRIVWLNELINFVKNEIQPKINYQINFQKDYLICIKEKEKFNEC